MHLFCEQLVFKSNAKSNLDLSGQFNDNAAVNETCVCFVHEIGSTPTLEYIRLVQVQIKLCFCLLLSTLFYYHLKTVIETFYVVTDFVEFRFAQNLIDFTRFKSLF